jgi:exodeoxyribonuclease-5
MIASKANNETGNLFSSEQSLLDGLIHYVKRSNSKNKIIFLGDANQLAPINEQDSKALDANYLSGKYKLKGKSYKLTQVKRQEDGSCILKNATITRDAIDCDIKTVPLEGFSKVSKNYAANTFAKEYKQNGFENIISIGATHPMNKLFNTMVRERLYKNSSQIIEKNELLYVTTTWKRNGEQLYNGDHVVVEEVNMHNVEMVSGLHFVPIKLKYYTEENEEKIIEDYLILESVTNIEGLTKEQENRLRYERRNKNNKYRDSGFPSDDRYVGAIRACYGYSITCNKAQGGEWDKVYLNNFHIPTMKFQYTAITRAKSDVILY